MVLIPYGLPFETNIPSYGLALTKRDQKTFISGVWNNSPAAQNGIHTGNEVLKINSMDVNTLSLMELIPLFLDENINSLEIEHLNTEGIQKTILHKGMLLPELK